MAKTLTLTIPPLFLCYKSCSRQHWTLLKEKLPQNWVFQYLSLTTLNIHLDHVAVSVNTIPLMSQAVACDGN